jgi:flagellar assembly protein FliH
MSTETFIPGGPETLAAATNPSGRDPAAVGLRRILSRRAAESIGATLHPHDLEQLLGNNKTTAAAACNELQLVKLERIVEEIREDAAGKQGLARQAVARAYEGGYQAGCAKGAAEARAEEEKECAKKIDSLQEQLNSFLMALEREKRAFFSSAENLLLALSFRMAKKILDAEPTLNDGAVLPVLKKALATVADRETLIVRVSPEDHTMVTGCLDFRATPGQRQAGITVEPDDRIKKGGCIIESTGGIIDATPGVQMSELEAIVQQAWDASIREVTK